MARRRKSPMNLRVIEAVMNTPFILLGPTKRQRKSAAKKWLEVLKQASK